ncbi:PLP-dependent aminotransferase family protein [Salinispora cortesiana]|uniref:MocR-like pyridoxine biosynthesis transcription factor PdxR n=1 Tax=Salinispora cortesiana TaxID=1305843 RepID=UPI00046FE271|nr:PLP-dependent aminotransferase family protein [Salinispora cortesiana]
MAWQLQLNLDRQSTTPLIEQLRSGIKSMIEAGALRPGAPLPSSRLLAADLRIARSVVVEAYQQLTAEGYLISVDRSGTRVANLAPAQDRAVTGASGEPALSTVSARWDLRTGLADVSGFPRAEWLTCLRRVLQTATPEHLEYPALAGAAELRSELTSYLGRVRAVRTTADTLMTTAGFAQGLALLSNMLLDLGHATVAVEDPGHPGQRRFLEDIGLRPVPVPVDDEGIDVQALAASEARAVLVTPVHQFPTGVVLSESRRAALVTWARKVDGIIVEDDYDAEFWFDDAERPPAVQGLAPERVVYGGSASKTLAPGLRIGWLAAPAHLTPVLERARARQDLGSSTIDQLGYADFIATGRLERHLRQMRRRYRERLEAFTAAVANLLPDFRLIGSPAGLHTFLAIPPYLGERALVDAAARRGVVVRGADHFAFHHRPPTPGLVVGDAVHSRDSLVGAASALAAAVRMIRTD